MSRFKVLHLLGFVLLGFSSCLGEVADDLYKWPSVGISVLVRNKAHTLPYFLTCLHNLDYPKDRLYLWINSDFNEDNSIEVLEKWVKHHASEYSGINLITNNASGLLHADEKQSTHWSTDHFRHVIQLREEALSFVRQLWADYIFMIDADVFLTNIETLKILVRKELPVVAPMLISDGLYSNFWCGMTENYYYKRTDDYKPILNREQTGCFPVPMVHTAVLMSLRRKDSDLLTYDPKKISEYNGPDDDIIAFAINAKNNEIPLHVCNDHMYGFVPVPLEDSDDPKNDQEQLLNIKLEAIGRHSPLPLAEELEPLVRYPQRWKFGLGEIYVINLERRRERLQLMQLSFKELGMDVRLVKAVDGRDLDINELSLERHSIKLMPGYEDPYHKRPMKAGEVGCFLSHHLIWKEMVSQSIETALVLEDDCRFVPYFRHRLLQLLHELEDLDWDLVYLGRKILLEGEEEPVSAHTRRPRYSYWTLGYALRARGARKLLAARPLAALLPVDEFLPIMFDQHPNETWKAHFPVRDLVALSAAPLLVEPTHYTGQPGYVSDTEDSRPVPPSPPPPPPHARGQRAEL